MRYRILFFAATFTILAALSSQASFQDPVNTSDKPLYQPYGNEPSVVGTISITGKFPPPKLIDMSADPVCIKLSRRRKTEWIETRQGKLLNAFVYVKDGDALKTYRFEVPDSEVVLEHKACRYSPHVLGMRVRQRLSLVNNDPIVHNTHPTPKSNQEWNMSQAAGSAPLVETFARPELFIPFKDNQHPWEKAYVSVLNHPFFAVSDQQGNYEIRGLPVGTYKLVVWQEVLGEQEIEITLIPGETRRVDFTFDADKVNLSRLY
jgi:hypothetical protein